MLLYDKSRIKSTPDETVTLSTIITTADIFIVFSEEIRLDNLCELTIHINVKPYFLLNICIKNLIFLGK